MRSLLCLALAAVPALAEFAKGLGDGSFELSETDTQIGFYCGTFAGSTTPTYIRVEEATWGDVDNSDCGASVAVTAVDAITKCNYQTGYCVVDAAQLNIEEGDPCEQYHKKLWGKQVCVDGFNTTVDYTQPQPPPITTRSAPATSSVEFQKQIVPASAGATTIDINCKDGRGALVIKAKMHADGCEQDHLESVKKGTDCQLATSSCTLDPTALEGHNNCGGAEFPLDQLNLHLEWLCVALA